MLTETSLVRDVEPTSNDQTYLVSNLLYQIGAPWSKTKILVLWKYDL